MLRFMFSRWFRFFVTQAGICAMLVCSSPAQFMTEKQPDPLAGRWELNLKKTHYGGGAQRRTQETFVCETKKAGTSCVIHSKREDGTQIEGRFSAKYDGTPAPVTGVPDVDEILLERLSDTSASATFSYHGNHVYAYRATRSSDGKTLTVVAVDPLTRKRLQSVVVYDLIEKK
jgi:hypothetical protein